MVRIIVQEGGSERPVELTDAVSSAGRSEDNRIVLQDQQSSRRHCQIERTDYGHKLVDLESRNGTRVNGKLVNQALLRPGDRIQIGKTVMVFEDPQFKEPPPEVAARFAPPTSPAPAALPPAEAPKPTPSPLAEDTTGRTGDGVRSPTTVHRTRRTVRIREALRERRVVARVALGAGLFGALVVALIVVNSFSGEVPAAAKAKKDYNDAYQIHAQNPAEALRILERIPRDQREIHARADELKQKIRKSLEQARRDVGAAEQKDFDALYDFCEASRQNPGTFDQVVRRCEDFKQKYPGSAFGAKIEEYLKLAREGIEADRRARAAEVETQVRDSLRAKQFGVALQRLNEALARHRGQIEARESFLKLHDDVLDAAQNHYRSEKARAKELKAGGKTDEARRVYREIIASMGSGSVEELRDYCEIARAASEALR
jgi:hypothetical protein